MTETINAKHERLTIFNARGVNRCSAHRTLYLLLLLTVVSAAGCRGFVVSRHTSTTLSNADADRIIADAVRVLGSTELAGDFRCIVGVQRDGDVTTFTQGAIINSQADLDTVLGLPGSAKVVSQINWCGALIPNVIGCAYTPGSSLAVVRFTPSQEGILWAHEFGHNKGLPHVTTPNNVMSPVISPSNTTVTSAQCDNYRR
jgi:hypothetical protein